MTERGPDDPTESGRLVEVFDVKTRTDFSNTLLELSIEIEEKHPNVTTEEFLRALGRSVRQGAEVPRSGKPELTHESVLRSATSVEWLMLARIVAAAMDHE